MAKEEKKQDETGQAITLSEALLAPLSSIFEAQIHASRAFLNFFLQMGFRHKYTVDDEEQLRKDPEKNKEILSRIDQEKNDKKLIEEFSARAAQLRDQPNLSQDEQVELNDVNTRIKELKTKWGDLYQQFIPYVDAEGNDRTLSIPNLALLPIKPLAIQSANFKFELRVKDELKSVDSTIRSAVKANPKRPWFLIEDPKVIAGEFSPHQKEDSIEKTIKIDVTIGTVEIPQGLSKLISSLTSIAEDKGSNNLTK